MAERRMLHRAASTSTDLAWLRDRYGPDAALFAVLLIPWYDRWGCVPADPVKLRAMVVPLAEGVTSRDVKRWVDAMVRRGMLTRETAPDGERGLRNPSFHEHQSGSHFDREAPSPWEPPEVTKRWQRKGRESTSHAAGSRTGPDPVRGREGKGTDPSPRSPSPNGADPTAGAPSGSTAPRPAGARRRRAEPQSAAEVLQQLQGKAS